MFLFTEHHVASNRCILFALADIDTQLSFYSNEPLSRESCRPYTGLDLKKVSLAIVSSRERFQVGVVQYLAELKNSSVTK